MHVPNLVAAALTLVSGMLLACDSQQSAVAVPISTPRYAAVAAAVPPVVTASPTAVATVLPMLAAREIDRGNISRRELALTFDCGGTAEGTEDILAALRAADVHVTFFLIGDWVRAHPELAREIAAQHEIANHSDTHPDFRDLTDAQIGDELEAADRAFLAILGHSSKPLWRAPSGARDDRVLAAAAKAGWPLHVFWTIDHDADGLVSGDSGDWQAISPERVAANLVRAAALGNGVITVSHCDSPQTRTLLPEVLRSLHASGVRVTTVSELLRSG